MKANRKRRLVKMKIKRSITPTIILAALVSAFGLAALTRAGAAGGAKNVTTQLSVPLDETVYDSVTGETVNFVGDVHVIAHTKFLADGTVKVSIQCDTTIPGTGDKTGSTYNLMTHDKFQFFFNAPSFPLTVTIQCNLRLHNAGSCNDIEVPVMVQFTIQKDGSVSAKYVEDGGGDITP
jgi:hypothetical protein